jgi:hypothetical protein
VPAQEQQQHLYFRTGVPLLPRLTQQHLLLLVLHVLQRMPLQSWESAQQQQRLHKHLRLLAALLLVLLLRHPLS